MPIILPAQYDRPGAHADYGPATSAQVAELENRSVVPITRRSWVRSPTAPFESLAARYSEEEIMAELRSSASALQLHERWEPDPGDHRCLQSAGGLERHLRVHELRFGRAIIEALPADRAAACGEHILRPVGIWPPREPDHEEAGLYQHGHRYNVLLAAPPSAMRELSPGREPPPSGQVSRKWSSGLYQSGCRLRPCGSLLVTHGTSLPRPRPPTPPVSISGRPTRLPARPPWRPWTGSVWPSGDSSVRPAMTWRTADIRPAP